MGTTHQFADGDGGVDVEIVVANSSSLVKEESFLLPADDVTITVHYVELIDAVPDRGGPRTGELVGRTGQTDSRVLVAVGVSWAQDAVLVCRVQVLARLTWWAWTSLVFPQYNNAIQHTSSDFGTSSTLPHAVRPVVPDTLFFLFFSHSSHAVVFFVV